MNHYIALGLCLPFIAFFILQFGNGVVNNHELIASEMIITAACEDAKQEGYFTQDIIDGMEDNFNAAGISGVIIEVTTTPKYRTDVYDSRELIEYKIGVPIDSLFVANDMFGISDDDNKIMKYYSGALASERLP